jgi:pimeloyl-ACP methyl ester carboxylesterase
VLYDRPGIGRSGPRRGTDALLASTVADELLACLHAIAAPPPYLLVGHSLGGLYVQAFARQYPRETAAVVLVDSASPLEPPGVFGSTVPPEPGSTAAAEEAGPLAARVAFICIGRSPWFAQECLEAAGEVERQRPLRQHRPALGG